MLKRHRPADDGAHNAFLSAFFEAGGVFDHLVDTCPLRLTSNNAPTNRTISDIAYDSGFASPTHLAAAFKRFAGMTMGEFRSST